MTLLSFPQRVDLVWKEPDLAFPVLKHAAVRLFKTRYEPKHVHAVRLHLRGPWTTVGIRLKLPKKGTIRPYLASVTLPTVKLPLALLGKSVVL